MGKIEEIIKDISERVIKAPYKELESIKEKSFFDFEAPFMGAGQRLLITASERKSGTIDFEFAWILGQLTSDCSLELLKMNHWGIKGPFFVSILDSDDPPCISSMFKTQFFSLSFDSA